VVFRPIKFAQRFVTQLVVEPGSLKAERVKPDRVAPAVQRPAFGRLHDCAPQPLALAVACPELESTQQAES
jgi:hypothetical protein